MFAGQNNRDGEDEGVIEPYRALQCDQCDKRYRLPGPKKSKVVQAFDFRCPLCQFQVFSIALALSLPPSLSHSFSPSTFRYLVVSDIFQ
jgi:hypothetical protein